jgi:hypothetical protein
MQSLVSKLMVVVLFSEVVSTLTMPAANVDYVKGNASASQGSNLNEGDFFGTKEKSQSQVSLDRSFFRVGSDSQVSLGSGRRIALQKGVMLVGSATGIRRQSVEVTAPGYKMKVKGTAQVAYYPGKYVKITVIEGSVTVALQSLSGEFVTLEPGQMLIINPSDKRLPEPVEVDLSRLISTSQLINTPFGTPSTKSLMDTAASEQANDFRIGEVARTPFMLRGAAPEVTLLRQTPELPSQTQENPASTAPTNRAVNQQTAFLVDNAAGGRILQDEITVFQLVNDLDDPTATVGQKSFADGLVFYAFPFPPGTSSITLSRTGARTRELTVQMTSQPDDFGAYLAPATIDGTIRADADLFGNVAGKILVFESQEFGADPFNDFSLHVAPGTDILTPPEVGLRFMGALGITVDGATLQAGNAVHPDELLDLRATERDIVVANSSFKAYNINMAGSTANTGAEQNITVDQSSVNAQNNITMGLPTARSHIALQNSTQLAALVGGITVQSKGGTVTVDTSTLTAAGGTITLDALDLDDVAANGFVTLRNSTLSADIIRVRGSAPGGDALLIDGGTYNANSLLKFYAESASTLRFRNMVNINSPLAILAGQTVAVDAGGSVNVTGRADVYSDNHQYNLPGTGTLNGGGGVNPMPHTARPGF